MDIITAEECQRYLGKAFYDRWDDRSWLRFTTGFVTVPDSGKLNSLARNVSTFFSKADGSVLLVENTGIFKSSENMYLAETFRRAFGETRSIREAPAYVFSSQDSLIFWSVMHICLLNFWDFLVVAGDRQACIHGSHDEVVELFALNEASCSKLRSMMLPFEFKEISPSDVTRTAT
jgi:hypothetical protein